MRGSTFKSPHPPSTAPPNLVSLGTSSSFPDTSMVPSTTSTSTSTSASTSTSTSTSSSELPFESTNTPNDPPSTTGSWKTIPDDSFHNESSNFPACEHEECYHAHKFYEKDSHVSTTISYYPLCKFHQPFSGLSPPTSSCSITSSCSTNSSFSTASYHSAECEPSFAYFNYSAQIRVLTDRFSGLLLGTSYRASTKLTSHYQSLAQSFIEQLSPNGSENCIDLHSQPTTPPSSAESYFSATSRLNSSCSSSSYFSANSGPLSASSSFASYSDYVESSSCSTAFDHFHALANFQATANHPVIISKSINNSINLNLGLTSRFILVALLISKANMDKNLLDYHLQSTPPSSAASYFSATSRLNSSCSTSSYFSANSGPLSASSSFASYSDYSDPDPWATASSGIYGNSVLHSSGHTHATRSTSNSESISSTLAFASNSISATLGFLEATANEIALNRNEIYESHPINNVKADPFTVSDDSFISISDQSFSISFDLVSLISVSPILEPLHPTDIDNVLSLTSLTSSNDPLSFQDYNESALPMPVSDSSLAPISLLSSCREICYWLWSFVGSDYSSAMPSSGGDLLSESPSISYPSDSLSVGSF
ncbi:unnamed protein product [[Candida] boidinii]|uniref:Unnamed protein product n=1 Tax=Candida boidinii TaxID=5477 RepID=A0ACB5TWR9_CANBO|nr:unnamed protein product [[Candida] boidinii]